MASTAAQLTFRVYNHTAGLLGSFTESHETGSSITLNIASLGEVLDGDAHDVELVDDH